MAHRIDMDEWSEQVEPPPQPIGTRGGKRAASKKAAGPKNQACFSSGCDKKKKSHGRFCDEHTPIAAGMEYQADERGERAMCDEILQDPSKCAMAMEEWQKNNPPGKFRKAKVDWARLKRLCGVRVSRKINDNEELMDLTDYIDFRKTKKSRTEAEQEWKDMLKEPHREILGKGLDAKMWISQNQTRQRVKEIYDDAQFEEGFKEVKGPSLEDRELLKNHTHTAAASFHDDFLRGIVPKDLGPAVDMETPCQSNPPASLDFRPIARSEVGSRAPGTMDIQSPSEKTAEKPNVTKKMVDLSVAGPAFYNKYKEVVTNCKKAVETVIGDAETKTQIQSDASEDVVRDSYKATVDARVNLLRLWMREVQADTQAATTVGAVGQSQPQPLASPAAAKEQAKTELVSTPPRKTVELATTLSPPSTEASPDTRGSASSAGALSARSPPPAGSDGSNITQQLIADMASGGARTSIVHNPSLIKSALEMEEIREKMLTASEIAMLEAHVGTFLSAQKALAQLIDGTKSAIAKTASHMREEQKKLLKRDADAAKLARDRETNAAKKKAKELAETIKQETRQVPVIFSIDLSKTPAIAAITTHDCSGGNPTGLSPDLPFVLRAYDPCKAMLEVSTVQLALATFSGTYSKQDGFKAEQKHQQPLFKGCGKEDLDILCQGMHAMLEASSFLKLDACPETAKPVVNTGWLWGYAADLGAVQALPNGLAQMKIQVAGEIRCILVDTTSVIKAFSENVETVQDLEDFRAKIANLTQEGALALAAKGAKFYTHLMQPKDILFVPAGWMIAERSVSGVLVYGMRKPFMTKSQSSFDNYAAFIDLSEKAKKQVDKMKLVLEAMKV